MLPRWDPLRGGLGVWPRLGPSRGWELVDPVLPTGLVQPGEEKAERGP